MLKRTSGRWHDWKQGIIGEGQMKERRRKRRYNAMLPCFFSRVETWEPSRGFVVNISEQGVAIESTDSPTVGSEVRVAFRDLWEKEIRFDARVVYLSKSLPQGQGEFCCFGVKINRILQGKDSMTELISELAHR